ncbi:T9SS type A sorting domain-containing protein [Pedobacter aquae]|uniref:T9SS type A sorting domain-containing protein n=1 Tax=Pedobacter aquae TaxID=2605747 RepID=A0A5C0VN82_9SPHI|nr:T9SS type A sorting domain-containing protein [Pedobacter aquae]QEK52484.1 T9SS type A sorting domain-containing protein [Pedobacter aquae]
MITIFTCKSLLKFKVNKVLISLFALIFASINVSAQVPSITSFNPLSAKPGDAVTITGTNFNTTTTNNVVFFGATKAAVTAATTTSLIVTVPTGATFAPITLLNTATGLATQSLGSFNPIYSPEKTNITTADFAAEQVLAAGNAPHLIAVSDLDGDGKSDLAVANKNSNTVSVYHNISNIGNITSASFATKVDFATENEPFAVAIRDLDGDGKPDLVVTNYGSSSISVFRNISTTGLLDAGSFDNKIDFTTGSSPRIASIGDLDGDGKPDLAVVNESSGDISILRNTSTTGSLSFAPKVDVVAGSSSRFIAIGDLNADGKLDLAVTNFGSNNFSVFLNASSIGNVNFNPKVDFTAGTRPIAVAIDDFDGDGKSDLAILNRNSSNISVFLNASSNGNFNLNPKIDVTTGNIHEYFSIGDLDGDSRPDFIVPVLGSNTFSLLRNTSSSGMLSFSSSVSLSIGNNPHSVVIADLDGDHKPDLVTSHYLSNTISILRNTDLPPTITSFSPLNAKPGDAVTITGTNFNTTTTNNVVFFGATRATVTAATATSLTVTVPVGATYDYLNVLNTGTTLAAQSLKKFHPLFSPSKAGVFTTDDKVDFAAGDSPIFTASGDLDGDGKADLVVANYVGNTISVLRNTATNGSISSSSFADKIDLSTVLPINVIISDIDGDGKPDVIVSNSASANISIFRNTSTSGNISFAAKEFLVVNASFYSWFTIGDFNSDGKPDIAVAKDGEILVYPNSSSSGSISFSSAITIVGQLYTYNITAADIDGDNLLDLVLGGDTGFTVYRNTSINGVVSFENGVFIRTREYDVSMVIGDLDGDTKLDVAVTYGFDSRFSCFLNTSTPGNINFAAKVDFLLGSHDSFALGDIDSDGKPDLLTANNSFVNVFPNTSSIGSINFGSVVQITAGLVTRNVIVGDIDGDTKPDLIVANEFSDNVSVIRNADIVPLPVSLISYQAKLQTNGTVQLNWLTASETNNSYFEILKSTDGKNFSSIAKVNGSGNSTQQAQYDYTDTRPASGSNYYQLIQYDDNGKQTDLGVRAVNVTLGSKELTVYPNPASSLINLSFEADVYQKLEVIDLTGKILMSQTIQKQENSISLDINKLSTGFYHIRLTGTGKITTKQIIKQ